MVIIELLKKRFDIRNVYKDGIGAPFSMLRYILPLIFVISFLFLIDCLGLTKDNLVDLIKQVNSLVGIILGFSIASFAIFISITNKKLENTSQKTKYTYRQIGSALFFYNVEVALFISLIGIILLYINLPVIKIIDILTSTQNLSITTLFNINNIKVLLFLIYVTMFFQLIFNLFYSSLFLNSSIQKSNE